MNGEILWDLIISRLTSKEEELQTTTGLWFKSYLKDDRLFVGCAKNHSPKSKITKPRPITKKDFLFVHSYYDRWIDGETGVRHEVSRKSRNTAYIFSLIDCFNGR
ncbi:hypothetical protein TPHSE_25850 [Terrisporobacter petrolearius]